MDTNKKPHSIDDEIQRVINSMSTMSPDDNDYATASKNLKMLVETKNMNKFKPSSDAILAAGANLLGILLVLRFEKLDVITSRAISMVTRRSV